MADRTETVTLTRTVTVTAAVTKTALMFEATVSTADTITMGSLTTLLNAVLFKKSDGAAVTCTVATNVITVTQGTTTDVPVVGLAYGS